MRQDVLTVALVIPRSGPAGIFGLSSELAATLAIEELNAAGGAGGREIRLLPVDGGAAPAAVAAEIDRLVSAGAVGAVVGWHISAVRQAIAPCVAGRVPYVYTALYEGGERTPGIFLTGETPERQLHPAMRLLREVADATCWCVVGNDYVWPRGTALAARGYAADCGALIADEVFVPLGTRDFRPALDRVARSGADAVLLLLVGHDAVSFNRAFAERRLHERCLRLSTLMDENMLLASGPEATESLWAAAGYFETLTTPESMRFGARYARRFGVEAPPIGSPGESCYEGMLLLGALQARGRRGCPGHWGGDGGYAGARGALRLRGNHVEQPVYLAEADGLEFSVLAEL